MGCDVLNLEWNSSGRDREVASLICSARREKGYSVLEASIFNYKTYLIKYKPKLLYAADPKENEQAEMLTEVHEITEDIELAAQGSGSSFGKGGMATKINAVKLCRENGIDTLILNGQNPKNLHKAMEGFDIGTLFTTT